MDTRVEQQNVDNAERVFASEASILSGVLPAIASLIESSIQMNFYSGGRHGDEPYGGGSEKWEPLKYREGTPLIDDAVMVASINVVVTNLTVQVAVAHPGATTQNYGDDRPMHPYGNENVTVMGHWPERPFVVLQMEDVDAIGSLIADSLAGKIRFEAIA